MLHKELIIAYTRSGTWTPPTHISDDRICNTYIAGRVYTEVVHIDTYIVGRVYTEVGHIEKQPRSLYST